MKPRADFACLGPKCRTDDGATVYELPVDAIRCPSCGSKRIKRLFNKIAVLRGVGPDKDYRLTSSSPLVRSAALLQPGFDHADAVKPPRDMRTYALRATDVSGLTQGKATPMTQRDIESERRRDPFSVAGFIADQAKLPLPTTVIARDHGSP